MSNPLMNEKAAAQAARAGWGAPDLSTRATPIAPITDGPISSWRPRVMTVGGTATATGVLLVLLLATATVGWIMAPTSDSKVDGVMGIAIGAVIAGFVCAIVLRFKPTLAPVLAPIYALAEGFFLGVISRVYDDRYNGIVMQAVGATLGVFAVMLLLYKSRILKVTERFKRIVVTAAMGLMLFYAVSFVIGLFTGFSSISFFNSASPMGILFSVFAAGLAAMMLAVDFDLIEKGAKAGWPKGMEWYAAFGLVATLVWLYLEILRLLSKLQRR
ncbi:MAG: Bax inhibitor-1/YccA family protein [Actinomycetota bacterium]|nr:Bax inhibitor-1/YccA family protein [Actinomycetota bacterium]